MLAALSASHKLGLALAGGAFIVFALTSAFLVPRSRPDFPGGRGLRWFVLACLVFFAGMMAAVVVFGRERATASGAEPERPSTPTETSAGRAVRTIRVSLVDFKIELASGSTLSRGKYTFRVSNGGKVPHNLTIDGPDVHDAHTPTFAPGRSAKLDVTLTGGTYDFYCSVPGHKDLGMDLKVHVSS